MSVVATVHLRSPWLCALARFFMLPPIQLAKVVKALGRACKDHTTKVYLCLL